MDGKGMELDFGLQTGFGFVFFLGVELFDVGTYYDGAFRFCIALFACFGNYSSEIAGTV
jgi:hypothetical protein